MLIQSNLLEAFIVKGKLTYPVKGDISMICMLFESGYHYAGIEYVSFSPNEKTALTWVPIEEKDDSYYIGIYRISPYTVDRIQ